MREEVKIITNKPNSKLKDAIGNIILISVNVEGTVYQFFPSEVEPMMPRRPGHNTVIHFCDECLLNNCKASERGRGWCHTYREVGE